MTLNAVCLVGRVGQDPEVRYFESSRVLCKLNLAVSRFSKNKETDWFELELWGKTAEIAANYVKKGTQIGIEGSLHMDSWNDRSTGASRSKPVIKVDRINLLSSKKDSEGGGYTDMEM